MSKAAVLALVWLFPLYALVPRFALAGPLGTDDVIPVVALFVCAVALAVTLGEAARSVGPTALGGTVRRGLVEAPALLLLLVFMAVATVTAMARAGSGGAALVALARVSGRLGLYVILLLAGRLLLDPPRRRQLLVAIIAVAALEGALGIAAYVGKVQGPWQTGMLAYPPELMPPGGRARVQGTFGGEVPAGEAFLNRANFYSAYLAMALMALAGLWSERKRSWGVLAAAAVVIGGILVSYSRMSLAAAFVGFVVVALLSRRWGGAALAVALVAAVVAASSPLRDRFLELGSDRVGQWTIALRVIGAHPWLGTGDGRYLAAAIDLSQGVAVPVVRTPHNSVLYAAASYGIVAGLALLALYAGLVVEAIRRIRRRRTVLSITRLGLVAAFLVHDLTNNLFFIPEVALIFWAVYAATEESDAEDAPVGPDR